MFIEYDTFSISPHWITAIEYNDTSGLSDEEETMLNNWLDNLPEGYKSWQYSDDTCFAKDDISKLMADCVEATLYMNHTDL